MEKAWPAIFMLLSSTAAMTDEVSDSCLMCHRNTLSLESWTAEALEERLRELGTGVGQHPLPLPELDDEALRALAEALAGD
ncbi:MAG TPA: hypothetical protein VIV14_02695 [Gammaproteobacteria bacterium]